MSSRRDLVVRRGRPDDEPDLLALDRVAWPPGTGFPSAVATGTFYGGRYPADAHLVAEQAGRLVGYLRLGAPTPLPENRHVLSVDGLAVAPDARRLGVGTALLDAAVSLAGQRGVRRLRLRVLSTNPGAQAFYERRGFVAEGLLRGEFLVDGEEVDDVLMALPLAPAAGPSPVLGPPGAVHHVELWVPDLPAAERAWGWLLGSLGWVQHRRWPAGVSWRRGGTYVVLEASAALSSPTHDRLRPGLNHLAFHVGSRPALDRLVEEASAHGWGLLFAERHPYAGGAEHVAAYLEDSQGFEVELVVP